VARAPQTERLEVLVGRWNSAGRTVPGPSEPAIRITGTDTYEWLAGGFFLVHRVDVRMGDEKVEVIELIDDPSDSSYPMRSFDRQGNFVTMTARVRDDGGSGQTMARVGGTGWICGSRGPRRSQEGSTGQGLASGDPG
jgi:Protein of unknown function (DUF1579)